jgi:hypothetical protein
MIPRHIKDLGLEAVDTYHKALPYGERWAEMCAYRIAPGSLGTDRAFMEGRYNNQQLDSMPSRQAKYVAQEARDAGVDISGKYYVGGLADKRAWRDPEAWVSGVDDIKRVAQKRRLQVQGIYEYDPGPAEPKRTNLNEKIVQEEVRRLKRKNPKSKAGELREKVIEKHALKGKGR